VRLSALADDDFRMTIDNAKHGVARLRHISGARLHAGVKLTRRCVTGSGDPGWL
jgi:hypothetical protein